MTSIEIVQKTLDFEWPERVARSFYDSDFLSASPEVKTRATPWHRVKGERWERMDEWGNLWARLDPTSKGEVVKGVLENQDDLDQYEFPDYGNPISYEPVRKARRENPEKWLLGGLPGFAFNIARKLRRLELYLSDLLMDLDRIHALHDRIDGMLETMIRQYTSADVNAVMFCEDWGTQTQLFIDPALWRMEFKPRFEKLCSLAHDCGVRVFMHSCGQIEAIVPDLIESGIDLLQFDQPELHGLDVLAQHQERGRITFWCPVDIQKTLQSRDDNLIRQRAREMLDELWKGRGGFVAGYYEDNASIGLEPKWQAIACEEFMNYGTQSRFVHPAGFSPVPQREEGLNPCRY